MTPEVIPIAVSPEEQAWLRLAARFDVPDIYRAAKFETSRPTPALAAARAFVDAEDARGEIHQGGVGCGKTTALVCVFRALVRTSVAFYTFPDLSRRLLEREQCDAVMAQCRAAEFLLLDDLGCGYVKPDGFVAGAIEDVIVHREARGLDLLGTTNLVPKQFRKMFGERAYDRLAGSWGRWVNVDGPSLRRSGA